MNEIPECLENAPEVAVELAIEERIAVLEDRITIYDQALISAKKDFQCVFNLLVSLAGMAGVELDKHQVDNGRVLLRWKQKSGRIVVP